MRILDPKLALLRESESWAETERRRLLAELADPEETRGRRLLIDALGDLPFSGSIGGERKGSGTVQPLGSHTPVHTRLAKKKQGRGRPAKFSSQTLDAAFALKRTGGTNRAVAEILYKTKRPTRQEVKNASTILRYHRRKNPTRCTE